MSGNLVNNLKKLCDFEAIEIENAKKQLVQPDAKLHYSLNGKILISSCKLEIVKTILQDIKNCPDESPIEIVKFHLKSIERFLLTGSWRTTYTDPLDRAIAEYKAVAQKELLETAKLWID